MAVPTTATLRGSAIASSYAVVVGDGGTVVRSADGGSTWSVATLGGAADMHAVTVDPGAHVTLAVDAAGGVWRSDDLATSFVREASLGLPLDAVALSDDGTHAVAAGAGGAIFLRDPLGSWHATGAGATTAGLHAALITPTGYYVVGDAGTLLASHDGLAWSPITSGTTAALHGLDDL
jgi:photosystem II stability/assembly factor-like uncharacterized protein